MNIRLKIILIRFMFFILLDKNYENDDSERGNTSSYIGDLCYFSAIMAKIYQTEIYNTITHDHS